MNITHYSLETLAHLVQGELFGDKHLSLSGLASLEQAQSHHISFVNAEKYIEAANQSKAGALIVTSAFKDQLPANRNYIVVPSPYLAFAQLTHIFEKKLMQRGIESTAKIHPSAIIADNAYIGHYVIIGADCVVGENTIILAHTVLGDNVEIGRDGFVESNVSLLEGTKIKDRVRIHANTVVGSEGFGFAPYQGKWHRIVQLGTVQIGHDVRIGSNCSIDRGALDDTIIEDGVIIDNLVQIAHNVRIGSNTAIAAKCGIAGSTTIGKNCILAGACGVVGHITITDNVTLTGMSMVTKSIYEAGTYSSGTALLENNQWKRTIVRFRQLADVPLTQIMKRLDHIQTQIESLESTFKLRK